MTFRFRGLEGTPSQVSESIWRESVGRAFYNLKNGLSRLSLPDLHDRGVDRPPSPISGNLDAVMVEVTAQRSGQEVRLEHSLGYIARNAFLVVPGQPVVWGPGFSPDTSATTFRTPWVPDGVKVTFPFKARFIVFGSNITEVPSGSAQR